jgi:hypothetical protein
MAQTVKTYSVITAATAAQTLDESVVQVTSALLFASTTAGFTALTPVTSAPGTTQIQFTGSVSAPSNTVTLNSAPSAGTLLIVKAVPAIGNPLGY